MPPVFCLVSSAQRHLPGVCCPSISDERGRQTTLREVSKSFLYTLLAYKQPPRHNGHKGCLLFLGRRLAGSKRRAQHAAAAARLHKDNDISSGLSSCRLRQAMLHGKRFPRPRRS